MKTKKIYLLVCAALLTCGNMHAMVTGEITSLIEQTGDTVDAATSFVDQAISAVDLADTLLDTVYDQICDVIPCVESANEIVISASDIMESANDFLNDSSMLVSESCSLINDIETIVNDTDALVSESNSLLEFTNSGVEVADSLLDATSAQVDIAQGSLAGVGTLINSNPSDLDSMGSLLDITESSLETAAISASQIDNRVYESLVDKIESEISTAAEFSQEANSLVEVGASHIESLGPILSEADMLISEACSLMNSIETIIDDTSTLVSEADSLLDLVESNVDATDSLLIDTTSYVDISQNTLSEVDALILLGSSDIDAMNSLLDSAESSLEVASVLTSEIDDRIFQSLINEIESEISDASGVVGEANSIVDSNISDIDSIESLVDIAIPTLANVEVLIDSVALQLDNNKPLIIEAASITDAIDTSITEAAMIIGDTKESLVEIASLIEYTSSLLDAGQFDLGEEIDELNSLVENFQSGPFLTNLSIINGMVDQAQSVTNEISDSLFDSILDDTSSILGEASSLVEIPETLTSNIDSLIGETETILSQAGSFNISSVDSLIDLAIPTLSNVDALIDTVSSLIDTNKPLIVEAASITDVIDVSITEAAMIIGDTKESLLDIASLIDLTSSLIDAGQFDVGDEIEEISSLVETLEAGPFLTNLNTINGMIDEAQSVTDEIGDSLFEQVINDASSLLDEASSIVEIPETIVSNIESLMDDTKPLVSQADSLVDETGVLMSVAESLIDKVESVIDNTKELVSVTDSLLDAGIELLEESGSAVGEASSLNDETSSLIDVGIQQGEFNGGGFAILIDDLGSLLTGIGSNIDGAVSFVGAVDESVIDANEALCSANDDIGNIAMAIDSGSLDVGTELNNAATLLNEAKVSIGNANTDLENSMLLQDISDILGGTGNIFDQILTLLQSGISIDNIDPATLQGLIADVGGLIQDSSSLSTSTDLINIGDTISGIGAGVDVGLDTLGDQATEATLTGLSLLTGLSFFLYTRLTEEDFSIWANLNSIIYLLLLLLSFGLGKTIPVFAAKFSINTIRTLILFKLGSIVIGIPILILLLNFGAQFLKMNFLQVLIPLGIALFIAEGFASTIKLLFYVHLESKKFNMLATTLLVIQMLISLIWITVFNPSSNTIVYIIIYSKIIATLLIGLIGLFMARAMPHLKNKGQQNTIDMENFLQHSSFVWGSSTIKSLTESNALLPLFTIAISPATGNMFKIAHDGAGLIRRAIIQGPKLLGLGKKTTKKKTKAFTFKRSVFFNRITLIYIPILILIGGIIFFQRAAAYGYSTIIKLFFIMVMAYIVEIILSPYEQLLEEKGNYKSLLISYLPHVLLISILYTTKVVSLMGLFPTLLLVYSVRIISSLMAAYTVKKQIKRRTA